MVQRARLNEEVYARKARAIVIRHKSGDDVVAILEIVSQGNKSSLPALRQFVGKSKALLDAGVHLMVIDLQPRTVRDPQGIHPLIWERFVDKEVRMPKGKPLTLASYKADDREPTAYVEPLAVGDKLIDMPIFLDFERYVPVPLEATYKLAYAAVPLRWRRVIEAKKK